ncbi:glucan biosynthesis protein [Paracoccus fistulariae]|uniref:Glucan biosynthesis protein n=1 Tax=Paracoccus fistulariae TaxID=658446 RepID=A0ABY7SQD7_9RHOB|nr:glucan biosynthesis protein [Paracoccus fistulariae]MDB6182370.1 glucan biosynthesis protein [Paracoccus fistulariae]WCR08652.1 glucan biosynthesis protein [Paracoccus fistulariae]
MKRRQFLNAATAIAAGGTFAATKVQAQGEPQPEPSARAGDNTPVSPSVFGFEEVAALAAERSQRVYKQPVAKQVGSFANLNYDQYRGIRFRRDADPLAGSGLFSMDLLPPGAIFYEPVNISVVRDGVPQRMAFDPELLEFDPSQFPGGADTETVGEMGWSGFRLRTVLNRPGVMDEFLVFQGATYFRAVARGTIYGLSARGMAIKTGSPDGEEFPLFTDFWIQEPDPTAESVRIYALLDSKSVAAAFQFDVNPGAVTMVRTRVAIFPRVELQNTGIAPLTSMFWFSPASRRTVDDYRPAVHDSDGLQMHTGAGQALWRTLAAHKNLQISSFVDNNPRGFGLIQRNRDFIAYQDAEAMYDQRPSAWIQPEGDWGEGEVRLIEIPVENEFNDNIVSYWLPKKPMARGERHEFRYRLSFAPLPPNDVPLAKVRQVRSGRSINVETTRSFIVDFDLSLFTHDMPQSKVTASAGNIVHAYLKPLPDQGVLRLAFEYEPGDATLADLQAVLTDSKGVALSETWLTRWTV